MSYSASRIGSSTNLVEQEQAASANRSAEMADDRLTLIRNSIGGNRIDPQFYDIMHTLSMLSRLPDYHDFHLNNNVANQVTDILHYIIQNYEIPLPKLLPEDPECLSLTWDNGQIKRYLSLTEMDADLTFFNREADVMYVEELCRDGDINVDRIAKALKLTTDPINNTSD